MTAHATDSVTGVDNPEAAVTDRESLTEDQVFHVLQNERRRLVLRYLEGRDEQVRMRDVAEQVAAWEHDTTVQQLSSKERQRVYIPLYQNHLPKLDELGVIDYNQSRGIVEPTALAGHLTPYLDPFANANEGDSEDGSEFPWELPYLGVAGVGTVLVVGKGLSLALFSMLPTFLLGVMVLLMFTATSGAQLVSERVLDS